MPDEEPTMTVYEAMEWTYSLNRLWTQVEYIQAHPEEFE